MKQNTTYKQTELGLIPDDWEVKKLGEIGNIITGSTPSTTNLEYYKNGTFDFIGPADLNSNKYIDNAEKKVTEKGLNVGRILKQKSVLVTCIGSTIGKIGINKNICITNQQINAIETDKNNSDFIYYSILERKGRLKLIAGEQAVPVLNKTEFSKFKIPLPPLPEQKKIADCLSTWDVAIEKQNALINVLTDRKKALMQQLLTGKKRLPGFSGEWKEVSLIELADFRRGSFPQPYGLPEWYDNENGEPFIQVYDVGDNFNLKPTTKSKISELAQVQSVFIKKGTLIVTLQGSIGKVAITNYDAYIDRTLLLFSSFKMKVDIYFIMYQIHNLFNIEKEKAPGGIIKTITKEVLSNFKIKLPSFEEQTAIAEILATADRELQLQKEKLAQLQTQKKGLMQVLLTGKKRLIN